MKKSLTELLNDYRVADVQLDSVDGVYRVYVESMSNPDLISCTFVVPKSQIWDYDLKDYVIEGSSIL